MSAFWMTILLQVVGVGVIIAEVFLPSGGLLSVLAAGVFGYSLYYVFSEISTTAGMMFVGLDVVLIPVVVVLMLKLLANSPATLNKRLSREAGVSSQSPDLEKYSGREGTALTDLRPAGMALIDGRRVDVVSRGDYVEKGRPIVVYEITGNQIVVRKK
jgi:membrane-bound ClpP family serine protease